jgi:hypothetical protein
MGNVWLTAIDYESLTFWVTAQYHGDFCVRFVLGCVMDVYVYMGMISTQDRLLLRFRKSIMA